LNGADPFRELLLHNALLIGRQNASEMVIMEETECFGISEVIRGIE
jgi:hypothetical protein